MKTTYCSGLSFSKPTRISCYLVLLYLVVSFTSSPITTAIFRFGLILLGSCCNGFSKYVTANPFNVEVSLFHHS